MEDDEIDAIVMNAAAEGAGRAWIHLATAETARDRLRNATAETHMRLHSQNCFLRLMNGSQTLADYSQLIARLYGFYAPLEARLRDVPAHWCYDLDPRAHAKAWQLGADLAALNVAAFQPTVLPVCTRLPAISSPGAFIGCMYVIEGAGLVGRIMARRLDTLLGTETTEGRCFFLGGMTSLPSRWSRCCAAVEQCAADGHIDAMVSAASDTFLALERWLQDSIDAPTT